MVQYSRAEDRLNSWSHAVGTIIATAVGSLFLSIAVRSGSPRAILAVALYFAGMMSCYVSSTMYHSAPQDSSLRKSLRRWDHAAIYWYIAGSYTPFCLIAMRPEPFWAYSILTFVWASAIIGTYMSFFHLKDHSYIETICYVLMGLSVLVAVKPLMRCIDITTFLWLIAEGVFYVTGAVIFAISPNRQYMHSIFHFFVLGGTICQMVCIWRVLTR